MTMTDPEPLTMNQIRLRGRISADPVARTMPSGDTLWTFRLVLARDPTPGTKGSRQVSDWMECAVWGGQVRRSVTRWQAGDVVEVTGALRRRFYRAGGQSASRVEVEVLGGRRVLRAAT